MRIAKATCQELIVARESAIITHILDRDSQEGRNGKAY
jgi:hypothetical protein